MIDGHDIQDIEKRLNDALDDMRRKTSAVAEAKQVQKFAIKTEAGLLARYAAPHILKGKPANIAKTLALADPQYQKEFSELKEMFQMAQSHIEEYEMAKTSWESARSLLSMARAQIQPSFHVSGRQQG